MQVIPHTSLALIPEGPLTFAYVKSKIPNDDFFDLSQLYREWSGNSGGRDPEWLDACRTGRELPPDVIRLFARVVRTANQLRGAVKIHGITYDPADGSFTWQRIDHDLIPVLPFSNEEALFHHVFYLLHGRLSPPAGQPDRVRAGNGILLMLLSDEDEPSWSRASYVANGPHPRPGCIDWEAIA